MRLSSFVNTSLVATTAITCLATSANADVIYRENFSVAAASTGDRAVTDVGWNSYQGANAATTSISVQPTNAITKDSGSPGQSDAAVNSNPLATGVASRVFFSTPNTTPENPAAFTYLLNTSEYTVDRSVYNVTSFEWYSRDNTVNRTIRAAVQVGGNWYVSGASTAGTANNSTWVLQSIAFDAANWRAISFTPGTTLSTTISATPVALPTSNITAFGVWVQTATSTSGTTLRLDQFTINADVIPIPEPASLATLGFLAVAMLRRRRVA